MDHERPVGGQILLDGHGPAGLIKYTVSKGMEAGAVIVVYDQDGTWIHNNADEAKATLLEVYGEKFGQEAYKYLQYAPVSSVFQ